MVRRPPANRRTRPPRRHRDRSDIDPPRATSRAAHTGIRSLPADVFAGQILSRMLCVSCRGHTNGHVESIFKRPGRHRSAELRELSQVPPPTHLAGFAQVRALPPGRSVRMARPSASPCDKTRAQTSPAQQTITPRNRQDPHLLRSARFARPACCPALSVACHEHGQPSGQFEHRPRLGSGLAAGRCGRRARRRRPPCGFRWGRCTQVRICTRSAAVCGTDQVERSQPVAVDAQRQVTLRVRGEATTSSSGVSASWRTTQPPRRPPAARRRRCPSKRPLAQRRRSPRFGRARCSSARANLSSPRRCRQRAVAYWQNVRIQQLPCDRSTRW
jgi:hypothetical protein